MSCWRWKKLNPAQSWIWHGFRGKPQQAGQLIKNGIYLSFGVHYPEETVKGVPVGRLFLETDDSPVDIEEVLKQVAKQKHGCGRAGRRLGKYSKSLF